MPNLGKPMTDPSSTAELQTWLLHVKSWSGVTPGAFHYYGRIECQEHDRDDITIERTLDAAGARELQRQERESARYQLSEMSRERAETSTWHAGDTTERFADRESLTAAAVEAFMVAADAPAALYTHMAWLTGDKPIATKEADRG